MILGKTEGSATGVREVKSRFSGGGATGEEVNTTTTASRRAGRCSLS